MTPAATASSMRKPRGVGSEGGFSTLIAISAGIPSPRLRGLG